MPANLSASGSETRNREPLFLQKNLWLINVSDTVHFKSHTFHSVKSAQHANGVVASPWTYNIHDSQYRVQHNNLGLFCHSNLKFNSPQEFVITTVL